MSDFLTRLVRRAREDLPFVRPVIGPRFGQEPALWDEMRNEITDQAPAEGLPGPQPRPSLPATEPGPEARESVSEAELPEAEPAEAEEPVPEAEE